MMKTYPVDTSRTFIGRDFERRRLLEIGSADDAAIVVVHGRRRVGKTELIERSYANRGLLKFEGRENQSPEVQRTVFIDALAEYAEQPALLQIRTDSWRPVLKALATLVETGTWTIFLEEFQWMCCYTSELIAELKFMWDNHFRRNRSLLLVLCGSSPSFMIREVVRSKALYNRSLHELALRPFSLTETSEYLGREFSPRAALDAHLAVGGIPEYLKYILPARSVIAGLAKNSFLPDSFFSTEKDRVFVSALAKNRHYEQILDCLAQQKFCTQPELSQKLGIVGGGNLTKLLADLDLCGFIERYTALDAVAASRNVRYQISDSYLQYYVRFIKPKLAQIRRGAYREAPQTGLPITAFEQWLGLAFERFCQREAHRIAKILEFSAVAYSAGPWFRRAPTKASVKERGFQIDLVFSRADRIFTLCEMKHTSRPVDAQTAREIVDKFSTAPLDPRYGRQRVLISTSGATEEVQHGGYFDRIIALDELLAKI